MIASAHALTGKVAIVTGAGSGIGRSIAIRLATRGATIVAADISEAGAHDTLDTIQSLGGDGEAIETDMGCREAADALVGSVVARRGRVDVLVNNAGIGAATPFIEQDIDDLQRIFAVNFVGSYICSQRAAVQMIAQGTGGRIVHIASVNGIRANPGRTAYGSSKAALLGLTLHMAAELGQHGITVNAVSPGLIDTPMSGSMQSIASRQHYIETVPVRRAGSTGEVAELVAFLASDASGYVTGQNYTIDGGFTA